MPSPNLTTLHTTGYLHLPSLLPPTSLPPLQAASAHITALARSGHWPHIRTLPKQFPPWPLDSTLGIWGVQHLLHPSLPHHELFAQNYFSDAIINVAKELLECEEEELVMELFNLLVRPERDFELRWHRDDVPPDATAEEEEARLGGERAAGHAQWNLALCEDESLVVVPGSHRRARTRREREAGPYEELEGSVVVRLRPGDAVFYDHNILHRGVYRADRERLTLHGSVGRVGSGRARVVLQHGVGDWIGEMDFGGLEGVGERAEGMRRRLVKLGEGRKGEFSQVD